MEDKDLKKAVQNSGETLENVENHIYNMEAEDAKNEKIKKRLKMKVAIRNLTILALIVVIIILLLRGCNNQPVAPVVTPNNVTAGADKPFIPEFQTGELITHAPVEEKEEKSQAYVTLPVIDDFAVSSSQPTIALYNPVENEGKFYIYYIFTNTDTNEVIFESAAVQAGFYWSVDFKQLLPVGEHNVSVKIRSQFADTGAYANGSISNIKITVKE